MAKLEDIYDLLKEIKDELILASQQRLSPNQINLTAISELSSNLGLFQAGEFRGGNKKEIGKGFSGVRLTENGILVYNNDLITGKIDADGDWFAGGDLSAPATTGFIIFSNGQVYNGETFGAGDILVGDNSSGKGNIFWDASAGVLYFRSGTMAFNQISTGSLSAALASVSRNSNQSINNATETDVTFTTEEVDDASFATLGTNDERLTIPAGYGGIYEISAFVTWASNATGYRRAIIAVNAGTSTWVNADTRNAVNGVNTEVPLSAFVFLSAGDYIHLNVYQNSTGSLNVTSAFLRLVKIR
jgi:hypothetical protein